MDLNGKVIQVTGGTGWFGRKFVETVLKCEDQRNRVQPRRNWAQV
jgi:FlaA1/EpsC-like NDP-sugar epimerase